MWKRASEVYPNYVLFNENIDPSDIKQGQLGDCWFLSSLAAVAEKPERIKALIYNQYANSAGCYLVKFYVNGLIKGVLVDDRFLFNENNDLIFAETQG